MALTTIKTAALADDAVTEDKIANAINTARAANTAKDLTALSASNLTSGTVPDARFPATLPAASAANLTAVPAANITGTLPAISAANLTNVPAANITGTLPAISGANLTGISAGKFASYAIIADRKSNGTNGGAQSSTNTWFVRDLNTEVADPDGIVSISSNQFTLAAGSYLIKWTCPAIRVQTYMTALYNVTDSAYSAYGESGYTYTSDGDTSHASGITRITISGTKVFEIRMIIEANNSNSADVLGRPTNLSNFSGNETYTVVEIYKES